MSAPICNAADREELGCNADDGLPCAACDAAFAKEAAYWAGQWAVASAEERDPAKYRAEMREAGRGHLVRP